MVSCLPPAVVITYESRGMPVGSVPPSSLCLGGSREAQRDSRESELAQVRGAVLIHSLDVFPGTSGVFGLSLG